MENIRKYYCLLLLLGFTQISSCSTEDYSKMSADELNKALVVAVKHCHSDEVRKLIQAGADTNQNINYIETSGDCDWNVSSSMLDYASKKGYTDIVKELTKTKLNNNDINAALIEASKNGCSEIVEKLIRIQAKTDTFNTALILAAQNLPYITRFYSKDLKDYLDTLNTALMLAAKNIPFITSARGYYRSLDGYLYVIKELLKAGAHVNYTDEYGNTALIQAIDHSIIDRDDSFTKSLKADRTKIIEVLLQAKANVNHANKYGNTALIKAIEQRDVNTVQILLQTPGININHANNDGNTALMFAIQYIRYSYIVGKSEEYNDCLNSQAILKMLVETPGIDFYHVNKKGDTAIEKLKQLDKTMNRY